mgnify:CR=1 FL=1
MSVPIEGSYGVRGIVVTSRVFGKDIAAIGIGERECVLVQGGQHVPTNPRSEGHSGLRSRISAYFVTVPDRHAQPCYLHAGHPLPVESPGILLNGHRYRHDPFLPERRLAATGRIRFELQLGNIQAAASRPLTSPGNDDVTRETISPHCGKTLPVNKHRSKTLEPGLRRRSRRPLPAGRADSPDSLLAVDLPMPTSTRRSRMSFFSFFEAFAYSSLKRFVSLRLVAMSSLSSIGKHPRRAKPTGRDLVLVSSMTSKPKLHAQKIR